MVRALPRYVVLRKRKNGWAAYFAVPDRLRPEDWPATYALGFVTDREDLEQLGEIAKKAKPLNQKLDDKKLGLKDGPQPGSILELIRLLEADAAGLYRWRTLAEGSRQTYRKAFAPLVRWSKSAGHPHASKLTSQGATRLLAQFSGRPSMRHLVAVTLMKLLDVAVMEGICAENIMRKIQLPPRFNIEANRANIWPDDYFEACLEAALKAEEWSLARMLAFQRYQAQRPSDAIRLASEWMRDGWLDFRQQKKLNHRDGGKVRFRIDPRFRDLLARTPAQIGRLTLAADGTEHTLQSYKKAANALQAKLGLERRAPKYLRATGVLERARAGFTIPEIGQVTGHRESSVTTILKHYLPQDDDLKIAASQKLLDWRKEQQSNAPVERSRTDRDS